MYYSTQGNNSSSTATSDNRDVPHSSFGGGLSIGGTVDYGLNEHLSVEIGINYLTGNLITIEDYSTNTSNNTSFYPGYTYNNSNSNINTTDIKYTIKAGSRVRFMPALKISSKTSTFTIYLKGGLVVGIGATINFNEEYGRFSGSTCSGGGGNTSTSNSNSYALTASK